MEEFHVTRGAFELSRVKQFLGVSFLATWCCGIRHSPLFTFQAGWSEALLEQILTTESDPAFVMLHSQQVSVSLDSRIDTRLQIVGIGRVLILSTNTNSLFMQPKY